MNARVGPYELLEELGRGASAAVFLAQRQGLVRPVALKVLSRATDEEGRERFLREARVASALQHPGIVGCFDIGEDHEQGWIYLALDYVEGGSLEQRLQRGPLEVDEALEMGARLADALEFAHTRGVLHRDLKPSNVLFDTQGTPKLTDFGLAACDADPRLTASEDALGTPLYMAPESFLGRNLDRRSDVYGLGAVLYHALTGQPPYPGKTTAEVAGRVRAGGAPSPSRLRPEVSAAVSQIVLKAMARDPENRFPDMAACATALRSLRARSSSGSLVQVAPVAADAGALPPMVWVGVGGMAFLATVLVALVFGLAGGADPAESLAERRRSEPPPLAPSPPTTPSPAPDPEPLRALVPERPPVPAPLAPTPSGEQGELSLEEASRALGEWDFRGAGRAIAEARQAGAAFDRLRTVEDRLAAAREEERQLRRAHQELYDKQLRPAEALAAVEESLKRRPSSVLLHLLRAQLLCIYGRYGEAADVHETVFRLEPKRRGGQQLQNQRFMREVAKLPQARGEEPWKEWIPLLGGLWRHEPGGALRGSAVGMGEFGFAGLVHRGTGRLEPPYTLSVEIELDCSKPTAFGGLVFGLRSTEQFLMVYVLHQPDVFTTEEIGKSVEELRKELGAWPKVIRCARMVDGRWQVIHQEIIPFPDTGWTRLEVEVTPGAFQPRVNGKAIMKIPVTDRLDGRVGIHKFYDDIVGFRAFRAERN